MADYDVTGFQTNDIEHGCDMDFIADTMKEAKERAKTFFSEGAKRVLIHKGMTCLYDKQI